MKVLVIGGSGHVGSLVMPYLAREHSIRILDRRAPLEKPPNVDFVEGDLWIPQRCQVLWRVRSALLYMAMGQMNPGSPNVESAFDVNVKGVYLA
jgi:nucleoside-diphosphate-sugar epimerase